MILGLIMANVGPVKIGVENKSSTNTLYHKENVVPMKNFQPFICKGLQQFST